MISFDVPPDDETLAWLAASDPSTAYLTRSDLFGASSPDLQAQIARCGAGAALLASRRADGHWGRGFYQPKWTSTHYTLLELAELGLDSAEPRAVGSVDMLLRTVIAADGGLNPPGSVANSDVCINGMALRYCAYFGAPTDRLAGVVDFLLAQRMADGGFNCRSNRSGAVHSSVHTTTSVIEGFSGYLRAGHSHRADEVVEARAAAIEFLLAHRLYRSCRTGEPIRAEFTRLHWPARWYFDVLRGLDAVTAAGVVADERLLDAVQVVLRRRRPDGRWAAASQYRGETHVRYPPAREPNPWVTVVALRVLRRVSGSGWFPSP